MNKLEAVRDLIGTEEKWTKEAFAKDELGESCSFHSDEASSWCLAGAICRIDSEDCSDMEKYLNEALTFIYPDRFENYVYFNDDPRTTHADVMRVLTYAIELYNADHS